MNKKYIIFILPVMLILSSCSAANGAAAVDPFTVEAHASDVVSSEEEASFSTQYNEKNKNRANNIQLAASAIDGVIIQPGEVFSFNDEVGPTTRENGYKLATVFFNKEETKGYGGGVCQVSSTLFNAAEMAGMEIIERHTHSLDVAYVEKGRDATTSRKGKLDLKFQNIQSYPVVIRAYTQEGNLTIELSPL